MSEFKKKVFDFKDCRSCFVWMLMRLFSILSKKTVYRKLETCTIYFEYKNIGEGVAFDYCKALCKCNIYLKTHNNVNFIDYVYVLSLPQTRNVCTLYYVELEKSA